MSSFNFTVHAMLTSVTLATFSIWLRAGIIVGKLHLWDSQVAYSCVVLEKEKGEIRQIRNLTLANRFLVPWKIVSVIIDSMSWWIRLLDEVIYHRFHGDTCTISAADTFPIIGHTQMIRKEEGTNLETKTMAKRPMPEDPYPAPVSYLVLIGSIEIIVIIIALVCVHIRQSSTW